MAKKRTTKGTAGMNMSAHEAILVARALARVAKGAGLAPDVRRRLAEAVKEARALEEAVGQASLALPSRPVDLDAEEAEAVAFVRGLDLLLLAHETVGDPRAREARAILLPDGRAFVRARRAEKQGALRGVLARALAQGEVLDALGARPFVDGLERACDAYTAKVTEEVARPQAETVRVLEQLRATRAAIGAYVAHVRAHAVIDGLDAEALLAPLARVGAPRAREGEAADDAPPSAAA